MPTIALLKRFRVGQQISVHTPNTHLTKAGTPTMGGLVIFATTFLVTVPFNLAGITGRSILLPAAAMVSCGLLGAADDLLTLPGRARRGLQGPAKLAGLLGIAIPATLVLHFGFDLRSVYIPFLGKFDIGLWYLPIAALLILGFPNAVNLSDGLDTLAGGAAALAFAAYGVIAFLQGQIYVVTFCFTVVGATLGFLWYNAHPAQVFMGNTGALALGATLAVVALMTGHWLLLPLIGLVFVAETASVILQVIYFKWTHGRRLFRMSPLHHHFELIGWSEPQITMRFWLVGMLAAMLGIALALS
jgi:phospho-N-acetylmuramoyl-pentapeptide-transferase